MVSQPMQGKTETEIAQVLNRALRVLWQRGYKTLTPTVKDDFSSLESPGIVSISLRFLAKSLKTMSLCNAVCFCKGWEEARGCCIEHEAAETYGLEILYEE